MKRQDFRELAVLRLRDAEVLFANGSWAGAYYIAGYSVECAFKACIAKRTERHEFPELRKVRSSYTHDLAELLRVANLAEHLAEAMRREPRLASNWAFVTEWSEEARYEQRSEADAGALIRAIQDRQFGVLAWLRKHW